MIFRTTYNRNGALAISSMKEKNVAGILALFLGGLGVHRFYLGQTGLGIFYLLFFWFPVMWIVGLIDAIAFFSMDNDKFDLKYNREYLYRRERERRYDYRDEEALRRVERQERRREARRGRAYYRPQKRSNPPARSKPKRKPANPYKNTGVEKFKEYDYRGAIEDFKKAIEIEPQDIATHFNLACAYSVSEQPDEAFRHLDLAVQYGFDDFGKIREHDKLAFLRIQDQYDDFADNGFRLPGSQAAAPPAQASSNQASNSRAAEEVEDHSHLLEQLKQLGELRDKGLLTEEEFAMQKKRLLK